MEPLLDTPLPPGLWLHGQCSVSVIFFISRSARATSVAAGAQSSSASSFVRSASVAPSSQLEGYSGIYGRQLAQLNQRTSSGSYAAARVSTAVSSTKTVQEKTTTTVEKSTKSKVDLLKEQKTSLEYGKSSKCAALRRAEIHAQNSGKDPRHVPVPRNVDDDICYKVRGCSFIISSFFWS